VKAQPISVNKLQNPFDYYSSSTSLVKDDIVNLGVENSGEFSVMTRFSVYLDENTELSSYHAERTATSSNKMKEYVLEPTVFTDDLYNEDNEAAMTKMMISKDEEVNFDFSYSAVGGNRKKKKMNKFLSELVLDTEYPQQVNVVITSSNFNATSYPSNSKHLWIVRCHPDYAFNIKFTHFDIEAEFDGINVFDITQEGSRRLVSDVTGLGITETNTNNLMIKFQSDCDVTMSGFRAVLTAVEKNNNHETTSSASDLPKTTQSTLDTTTYNPEKTSKIYETTQTDTTTYQEGTSLKMTTSSNLQTTTSVLGRLEVVEQYMTWTEARQYCMNKQGDLIQKDPRLLTTEGRTQLSEELGLRLGNRYHTGIRRSPTNKNVYIRSGDGVQINLTGWFPNYPHGNDGYDYLYWYFRNNSNKNTIFNNPDHSFYFICEY